MSHSAQQVFFRIDDIGKMTPAARASLTAFAKRRIPLHCSIIPTDLDSETVALLRELRDAGIEAGQHGYQHENHARTGEFGRARSLDQQRADIRRGSALLDEKLGKDWLRIFTPPFGGWTVDTLRALSELEFRALSVGTPVSTLEWWKNSATRVLAPKLGLSRARFSSHGSRIAAFPKLIELSVRVDTASSYHPPRLRPSRDVLRDLESSFAHTEHVGVMLHPQHYAGPDELDVLGEVLDGIQKTDLRLRSMSALIDEIAQATPE